jgi:methylglutaconyl-CoA hydratase
MDQAIQKLAKTLSQSNPEAMAEMKKIFWAGTEHWQELLPERASISGRLVLSDFCKKAISAFKSK